MTGLVPVTVAAQLEGDCTVTINSGVDATTIRDSRRSDPLHIEEGHSISYTISTPEPPEAVAWSVWVEAAGLEFPLTKGQTANPLGRQVLSGEVASSEVLALAADAGPLLTENLVGIYQLGAELVTDEGDCRARGYVLVRGSLFGSVLSRVGLAAAVMGVALMVWSGAPRPGKRHSRREEAREEA